MTAKKRTIIEQTPIQVLYDMVRNGVSTDRIVNAARALVTTRMYCDENHGPHMSGGNDYVQTIWVLATALNRLRIENETLQGKLRRGNRNPAKQSLSAMLKKTPETAPQPQAS